MSYAKNNGASGIAAEWRFPHMCRDGHPEIGFKESETETCPVCDAMAALCAALSQVTAEEIFAAKQLYNDRRRGHRDGEYEAMHRVLEAFVALRLNRPVALAATEQERGAPVAAPSNSED